MATLLLDTSVIIDTLNGKRHRREFLRDLVAQGNTLACSAINVAEIHAGTRPMEETRTAKFLASLEFYPITFPVAQLAGQWKREFAQKGTTLSISDTLIAAVAIYNRLPLLTDNVKDFPMKELQLFPLPRN